MNDSIVVFSDHNTNVFCSFGCHIAVVVMYKMLLHIYSINARENPNGEGIPRWQKK